MQRLVLAVLVAQLVACAADEEPPPGYGSDIGTPENPAPSPTGYVVRSRVTAPLGVAEVTTAIANLQAFSLHGGTTLLAQTTPSAQTLNAIPSTLRTKLDGWIDTELDKQMIGTTAVRQAVGQIATMATFVVGNFVIESSLMISPTGGVHTLTDLTFEPSGFDIVVPIGGLMADKLDQKPTATVGDGGALALGDQQFSLAFGSHAWQGINLASGSMFGGDITIVEKIDCNAVAQAVAARCVSSSCVGHASDLLSICQSGIPPLVDALRDALAPVQIDTLRFASGTAHLADDNKDGVAERITMGTWEAAADFGMGAQPMQVTFSADKH